MSLRQTVDPSYINVASLDRWSIAVERRRLNQQPDHPTDQSPRKNDQSKRERRPRTNGPLTWTSFARWSEETQLLIERQPIAAEEPGPVRVDSGLMSSIHRFRPPATGLRRMLRGY